MVLILVSCLQFLTPPDVMLFLLGLYPGCWAIPLFPSLQFCILCPALPHLRHSPCAILLWYLFLGMFNFGPLLVASRSMGLYGWGILNVPFWFLTVLSIFVGSSPLFLLYFRVSIHASFVIAHNAMASTSSWSSSASIHACCNSFFIPAIRNSDIVAPSIWAVLAISRKSFQ